MRSRRAGVDAGDPRARAGRLDVESRGLILVVEDDVEMRRFLEDELREVRYEVVTAEDGFMARDRLAERPVDVIVTDQMMPGIKGTDLLAELRVREPRIPVVIITAFGNIESAVDAMRAGAYHYVAKPFRIEQLLATLERALRERKLELDFGSQRRRLGAARSTVVAESIGMRRALAIVARAAPAHTPLLLHGESGVGKEVLARTLHASSPRRNAPFVAVNCSAIPETLLESQLFGHRRGSFTDAREDRRGLFQEAEGGTILLDEIGDMPVPLQGKILRVLQEKEVHPLGAPAPVPIDVRVVAATHRDLESLIAVDRFRRDLYYRLNVISVRVPPLRERPEDLVPLMAHLLEKHGPRLGRRVRAFTPEAMELMKAYSWPGNVRELENTIERALVLGTKDTIGVEDLPAAVRGRSGVVDGVAGERAMSLAEIEREHVLRILRAAGGNRTAAARLLALDRKTLYRKLRHYGIKR